MYLFFPVSVIGKLLNKNVLHTENYLLKTILGFGTYFNKTNTFFY